MLRSHQTRPVSDQADTESGMLARLTAQGGTLRKPRGRQKQQSREERGKVEVVVGGQSDCIDRIVGRGSGGGGRKARRG